jgi:hypothetical protein
MKIFLSLEEVQYIKYHFPLKNDILHSLLYVNLDSPKLLQMSLDNNSLKLDTKEKRIIVTINIFENNINNHR